MEAIVRVNKQEMRITKDFLRIVEGSQEFSRIKFVLDNTWDSIKDNAYVQFVQRGSLFNSKLDEDGVAFVPPGLKPGAASFYLIGYEEGGAGIIGTSNCISFRVEDMAGISGVSSDLLSESERDAIIERADTIVSVDGFGNLELLPLFIELREKVDETTEKAHSHPGIELDELDNLTDDFIDKSHEHENKGVLDSAPLELITQSHTHDNMAVLDQVTENIVNNDHTHNNMDALENLEYAHMSYRDMAIETFPDKTERVKDSREALIASLEMFKDNVEIYGVRFEGAANEGETVKRLYSAQGLVAGVGTDTETAVNDFDNIYPWSARKRVCGTFDSNGDFIASAYEGEPGYTTDGSMGNVWVEHSLFFYKHVYDGDAEEFFICEKHLPGFSPAPIFQRRDGSLMDRAYTAAYLKSSSADSISGVQSLYQSLNASITSARTLGDNYTVTTMAEWYTRMLYVTVEFGTRNAQDYMRGAVSMPYTAADRAVIEENGTNRIVIPTSGADGYRIGMVVSIGAVLGTNGIARDRILLSIEPYDEDNSSIEFDGNPADVKVGHYLTAQGWLNGTCDSVLSSSGSYMDNSSGKYPCVYRGEENPWGIGRQGISDILVDRTGDGSSEDPYVFHPYYLPNPTLWDTTINDNFVPLSYKLPASGYIKKLGFDERFPWVRLPETCGDDATSITYYSDYYSAPNPSHNPPFAARVGGYWFAGTNAGLFYCYCYNRAANSAVTFRSRLSYYRL